MPDNTFKTGEGNEENGYQILVTMSYLQTLLSGSDLRSIGKSNLVVPRIETQNDFDELFKLLFHKGRIIVMRAADAIEKITIFNTRYLTKHKNEILALCDVARNKELKWHLALLIPRLHLANKKFDKAWHMLMNWAKDNTNSRIVRVNSIQALAELANQNNKFARELNLALSELDQEKIPSLKARIKKIRAGVRQSSQPSANH